MAMYRGVSGVARQIDKMYRGVSSVARAVKYGYRGVEGIARRFFDGKYIFKWFIVKTLESDYTINSASAGESGGIWKFILNVTGKNASSTGEIKVRLYLYDGASILEGKKITFEYTSTTYDARYFTGEFNCYDEDGNQISQNALSVTSTYKSKSFTIPEGTHHIGFGYWCNPTNKTWSGTLCVRNVVIDGIKII